MIYAFTGKTGSGKTYNMVRLAYREWLRGTDIYSNTWLNFEKYGGPAGKHVNNWLSKSLKFIKPTYVPKKRGKITYFNDISELIEVNDGLILIDEAQVLFNARNWEALPHEFQYKLQQHRKHRLDLYCTTQNMGTIDITYRRLVQMWFHHYDIFALLWKRNPSLLTLHRVEIKDIDYLYNSVDDLQVPTIANRYFTIHKLKKWLYDTYYDIGFKLLKTIVLKQTDEKMEQKAVAYLIPKQMQLKDALKQIFTIKSQFIPKGSKYSK